jgi:hypothetical protein
MGEEAAGGEGGVEDQDAVEGEDASNWWPRCTAIAAMTTSRQATRILRIRIRRVLLRAGLL